MGRTCPEANRIGHSSNAVMKKMQQRRPQQQRPPQRSIDTGPHLPAGVHVDACRASDLVSGSFFSAGRLLGIFPAEPKNNFDAPRPQVHTDHMV